MGLPEAGFTDATLGESLQIHAYAEPVAPAVGGCECLGLLNVKQQLIKYNK